VDAKVRVGDAFGVDQAAHHLVFLHPMCDAHPRAVVVDEAQRLPAVFPVLRHIIDRSRSKGRFLLLGSASPALVRSVSETLAGRVALIASFEGLVIEELAGLAARRLVRPELFFWRTQAGAEVDLPIVEGRRILPIEIKLGAAVDHYAVAGLRQCMKDLGLRRGWVVSTARERRRLSPQIEIVPWAEIAAGEIELF
jgi:predicted AAA+ superfamily ATPase